MKKALCVFVLLVLLLPSALGEGNVLLCVNCTVDGQTSVSFDQARTFIAVADDFDRVVGWRINGQDVPGETFYYISFYAKGDTVVEPVYAEEGRDEYLESHVEEPVKSVTVTAIGAKLQYLDTRGRGAGPMEEKLDFSRDYINPVTKIQQKGGTANFKVTANYAHGSQIAYWVIDGVRYNFFSERMPTFITIENLTEDMTIEVVYKNSQKRSQTLLTDAQIQARRTGERLTVNTVNATLSMVQGTFTRVGPRKTYLDFTEDYRNDETKQLYKGGSCDILVVANVDDNLLEKVIYWKFNDVKFTFSTKQARFSVLGLNRSMVYAAAIGTDLPAIIIIEPEQ